MFPFYFHITLPSPDSPFAHVGEDGDRERCRVECGSMQLQACTVGVVGCAMHMDSAIMGEIQTWLHQKYYQPNGKAAVLQSRQGECRSIFVELET